MSVVLPIGGRLPERDATLGFAEVSAGIDAALAAVTGPLTDAAEIGAALRALAATVAVRASVVMPGDADPDAQRGALQSAAPRRLSDDELANFAIYDDYFGVVRATLGAPAFAAVLLGVWAELLVDLARAQIGRDEVEALLRAFRAMLARAGDLATAGAPASEPAPAPADGASSPLLEDDGVPRRWRLGHYAFALAAAHACDAFDCVATSAAPERELATAALMTRATAAAQWYASEFPFEVYRTVVRPTMERSGARGGFSGTQNADYRCMEWARERAFEALFTRFGTVAAAWPAPAYAALMQLREMEIEAAEHHVLVAASKVRVDGSLAQKAQGDPSSAVAVLREKVAAVADDIAGRFDAAPPTRRVRACAVADVPAERPLAVTLAGAELAIVRAYGAIWACAALCTHAGGDLCEGHVAGNALVCPLHGAKFDPRTGAVLHPPATEPLATYPVTIEGADVYVDLT